MKLQASYDNGETWIGLDRYAAVVSLVKVRAGGGMDRRTWQSQTAAAPNTAYS